MTASRKKLALAPRRQPVQERAILTCRAIVGATARLLEKKGYDALTTNQVARAAGVGIASVYEYFPGKQALVAAVVTDVVDAVIGEIGAGLPSAVAPRDAASHWIALMFRAVEKRRRLLAVLVQEVPFLWQVPAARDARERLYELSRAASVLYAKHPGAHTDGLTYLLPVMVSNAILDAVVRPPKQPSPEAIERALAFAVQKLLS
jgi:AcrR family transcriptional regulator